MNSVELRKVILDKWGDLHDISDFVEASDIIKVIDDFEAIYDAVLKCIEITREDSRTNIILTTVLHERGLDAKRKRNSTTDSDRGGKAGHDSSSK